MGQENTATDLTTFLASLPAAGTLTKNERLLMIDQALLLLEGFYVHRPLKEAMYAVRPAQRLRLLRYRLEQTPDAQLGSDLRFHNEMTQIFVSLRDLHTNYLLPSPYRGKIAFLPFLVEAYYEGDQRKYLVSRVKQGFSHPTFAPGVEVVRWNGMPMERAVEINADRQAGSNPDARHARGLDAMTIRPLVISLPPDAEWEIIGYRAADGTEQELRQNWQVFTPTPAAPSPFAAAGGDATAGAVGLDLQTEAVRQAKQIFYAPETLAPSSATAAPAGLAGEGAAGSALGLDLQTEAVRQAKQFFFAPETLEESARLAAGGEAAAADSLESRLPGVLKARSVPGPQGNIGYIRIYTFNVDNADAFVAEFIRLAGLLPPIGLIVDVRGNGGGLIWAGERLLQVLTPNRIEPERLQFINTPQTLDLSERHANDGLGPWVDSIQQSVATGATYSRAFPITSEESCNALGQRYVGPVLLIIDPLCYSTTDIFSAGFQDHQVGPIMGVGGHTGAGGANVWTHSLLRSLFPPRDTRFQPLPQGGEMRVAIRQTIRVGPQAGTLVEDLGVIPDRLYKMSRNDLLQDNVDLIQTAAGLLASQPIYKLVLLERSRSGNSVTVAAQTGTLDRLDYLVNDRPQGSLDVTDGEVTFPVTVPPGAGATLLVRGYQNGKCKAAQQLAL
jgi:hypothetical protein